MLYTLPNGNVSGTLILNGGHSCQNLPKTGTFVPTPRRTVITTTPKTKTCTKCKQTKPTTQFRRRLSLAQSRAVLRNPNITTNYMADSKLCKACQPKRKPPRLLTAKQIRNRITDGDIRTVLGEAILAKRKESLPRRRAKAMREHWQKVKTEPVEQTKKNIAQQVAKFSKRLNASRYLQDATKEQNRWNYMEAKRIRNLLVDKLKNGEKIPADIDIQSMFKIKQD
jgi:hypothetical protein